MNTRKRKRAHDRRSLHESRLCWVCRNTAGDPLKTNRKIGGVVVICRHCYDKDADLRREFPGRTGHYILDRDGQPVECDSVLAWGTWYGRARRPLGNDVINGYQVSTIFLGLDYNFFSGGPPILWETMIFPPSDRDGEESYMVRYASPEAALANHERLVSMLRFEARAADAATAHLLNRLRDRAAQS